jgi:hypothetical protein
MYASPKLTQKKDKSTEANESEHSKQQDSGKENEASLKLESYQLKADQYNDNSSLGITQLKSEANTTGLPDNIKNGVETLSGQSLDDVKVHYNSDKPAQMKAHAYAAGNEIHVAGGQEKHIAHEAWHVVQQKRGDVKATNEIGGTPINDDKNLENEADVMGQKAHALGNSLGSGGSAQLKAISNVPSAQAVTQNMVIQKVDDAEAENVTKDDFESENEEIEEGVNGADVEGPKPVVEEQTLEGNIPMTGLGFKGSVTKTKTDKGIDKMDGEVSIEGIETKYGKLTGTGKISQVGNYGRVEGNASMSLETPEFKGEVPLARVPLGVPGVYAAVDLGYSASASVSGQVGFQFDFDSNTHKASEFKANGTVSAGAEANLSVFGGVAAGVPGVAEVAVGGQGTATAKINAELAVDPLLNIEGEISGIASGSLSAVAQAKLLWYTKSKSIPIVEGKLGSFKKSLSVSPINSALEGMRNIGSYAFERDQGDHKTAEIKAQNNAEDDPKKLNKEA